MPQKTNTITPYHVLCDRIQKRCIDKRRPNKKENALLAIQDATVQLRDASEFRLYADKWLEWSGESGAILTKEDNWEFLQPITNYCKRNSLSETEIKCIANIYVAPVLGAIMKDEDKNLFEASILEATENTTDSALRHYAKKALLKLYAFDMAYTLTTPDSKQEFLRKMLHDEDGMTEEAYHYYNGKFGDKRLLPE